MLQEWCIKTSLNGVIDLYEAKPKKWQFGFWIIVMISMLVLTVLFITINIMNFINSPTMTYIATIVDNDMETPELLLCYKGGVNIDEMKKKGLTNEMIKAIQVGFKKPDPNFNYTKLSAEFQSLLVGGNLTIEDFYKNVIGFPCESILKMKKRAGDGPPLNVPCTNVSNFVGKFGQPCLLFQSNGNQKWPTPSTGGIQITMMGPTGSNPQSYDTPELMHSFELVVEKKVVVATDQTVEIPLQYKTNILMSLTESVRLPKVKPCNPSTIFTTPNACYQRCYNTGFMKSCGCTLPGMTTKELDPNITMCNVFHFHLTCSLGDIGRETTDCSLMCIPLCKEFLYALTISYVPLTPNETNLAHISIAFSYQQYTKVSNYTSLISPCK